MFSALDAFLIVMAGLILVTGLAGRRLRPRKGDAVPAGDWAGLLSYLFFHRSIRGRRWVGWAHLVLFWGFFLFLLVVILDQLDAFLLERWAMVLSLMLDIAGGLMLISVLFLLARRCLRIIQAPEELTPKRTLLPLILLALIITSGFLAEGARLRTDRHPAA